jgi:hypothetical protein
VTTADLPAQAPPEGSRRPAGRLVSGRIEFWYRDLISCLQATLATVLIRHGHDPVEVLGSHWEFRYLPGDVRPEEFYYPCRHPGDVLRSLAPRHPATSRWRRPADPDDPLAEIRAAVAGDRLTIAAVDNFHLPFRPAFADVHAAHLVVVYGLDERRGVIYLSDAMPPAFSGPVPLDDFLSAWGSLNPPDEQDAFFSSAGIDRRMLDLTLGSAFPTLDAAFLRRSLRDGRELAAGTGGDPAWTGLPGLSRFLDDLLDRARAGDATALAEAYPFGWGMQAQSCLHAELLRRWGTDHEVPALREASRLVEAVAHAWTGLRITAAHGRPDPAAAADDLAPHAAALRRRYEVAVEGLAGAEESL